MVEPYALGRGIEWLWFSPANYGEYHGTSRQHDLNQRQPLLLGTHFAYELSFPKKWPKAGSPLGRFLLITARLPGRVLALHYHRHCTHASFTAVLGVDVLEH